MNMRDLTKTEQELIQAGRENRVEDFESLLVDMMLAYQGLKATTRVLAGCTAQELALVLGYLRMSDPNRYALVVEVVDFFTTNPGAGVEVIDAYYQRLNND